ncbi:MAG TPA: FecR domain-containing protein, partial [Polyangiales bacterium]
LQGVTAPPEQGTVTLDDGSRIHLAAHSQLELIENSGERVRSVLHAGWARFEVKPGGPRRWIVDAGLAEVQVVGTAFTVSTSRDETHVRVHHGRVLVRSALVESGLAQLNAGDTLHLRARPEPVTQPPAPSPALQALVEPMPVAEADTSAPAAPQPGVEAVVPPPASEPALQPRPASGAAAPSRPRVASTSFTLRSALEQADALRAQGEPRRAAQLLARELWAHPGAEGLGLTALTLAQLQLDELHEPAQAARSFALAHEAPGLPPALREQALARQVEALVRANQHSVARARADEYARRYPAGAWLPAVRDWLTGAE